MNLLPIHQWLQKLKGKKKGEILIYAGVIAVIGVLFVSSFSDQKGQESAQGSVELSTVDSADEVEEKMARILSRIKGVGKVEVMVTYETGPEIVPVFQTDKEVNTVEEDGNSNRKSQDTHEKSQPATVNKSGSEEALVLKEKKPEIRGVIVIAQGAEDAAIRLKLNQAVRTVLNITAEQVDVFEMD